MFDNRICVGQAEGWLARQFNIFDELSFRQAHFLIKSGNVNYLLSFFQNLQNLVVNRAEPAVRHNRYDIAVG